MEHFKIENLSFTYPLSDKKALDDISFSINKGDYIALCGKSGSGKSTLLHHLKPILSPHGKKEGTILFNGVDIDKLDLRTHSSKIGFVMQNPDNQIVTDKVWHELAFGLENLGVPQKTIRLRVAEMANYFGIDHWFHKNVNELSGGQKQLLNLAAVMAMQPEVLILDEPTSQLDPIASADFLNTIKKINLELATTIIITEHRLENVFDCATKVLVMDNSKLIANDSPKNIGAILQSSNNDMMTALPSPIQIFYGAHGKGECPLTVREGRTWLSDFLSDKEICCSHIDEQELPSYPKTPAIELKELCFRYEKTSPDVLKNLSLTVQSGSFLTIMGGNGTGKSTLLKSICGINKPYSGKVIINGKPLKKYKSDELFKNNLSLLPQDPSSLFLHKTVEEDLMEMTDPELSIKERQDEMMKIAELTEVTKLLKSHPFDISGGEKQRAALAKILLTHPKILLMDEPTKGMDNFFKIKLASILKKLTQNNVTIVMVSHDVEFTAKYADEVALFFDGDILTVNTPNKFFSSNSFYTTAANRMSRHVFENAITNEDVISLCKLNTQ